ncbi:hypothetical protein CAEBREN_29176 [Caenorhabditis brenneri]|uniref:Oxoglutarate/iron-dependent oxygenase C-terminal degradation domain-containing protein n=1 Tax=Caenorhabditis brenneri TaxID=135651 RepID=G0PKI3_CAEBE|nr:hypothetical protein CAEBREN_29176 [Caenorhabditis brenneri]
MKRKTKEENGKPTKSPKPKKRKSVVMEPIHINPKYLKDTYESEFKKGFEKSKRPFPHWQLRNFVENSDNSVEKVEEELQNFEDWQRKENDLYSLYQTNDLKSIDPTVHPAIFSFRQFLYTEVKEWLQKVSGVELTEQILFSHIMTWLVSFLLPNFDCCFQIETRRFAFVYYLTAANWDSVVNGGDLQLFNHDISKRHVARLNEDKSDDLETTNRLIKCLKSTNFAKLAAKLTGVTVSGAETSVKVSRVEHGTYWVLGDEDAEQSTTDGYCLDVHLFVQKTAWEDEAGGELIYIAEEETEEVRILSVIFHVFHYRFQLLRISPSPNAASVVFREPGVISFLKYANCKASDPFFLLTVSFYNVKVVDD